MGDERERRPRAGARHEYCAMLGDPRYRGRHDLTDRSNEIEVVRCTFDARARCSTRLIQMEGRVARFQGSNQLSDGQPPGQAPVEPNRTSVA